MKPGTSQKKPKSGKQNCRKQKLLESDIAKQNGPILTRKTATTTSVGVSRQVLIFLWFVHFFPFIL
jgi:hypothetical protein